MRADSRSITPSVRPAGCLGLASRVSKNLVRPQVLLAVAAFYLAGGSASQESLFPQRLGLAEHGEQDATKSFAINGSPLTVNCKTGPLRLAIDVTGELDCVDKSTVESDCAWTVRIIDCVEQGAFVKEGDVVMTLDSSDLETRAQRERVDVVEAQADLDNARERLAMQRILNESRLAKSELAYQFAQIDLETYRDGNLPRLMSTKAGNVELAREAMLRAKESYEFKARMARKGYETSINVEQSRITMRKAEHNLSTASDQYNLLQNHQQLRTLVELQAKVDRMKDELERAEAESAIALRSREIDVVYREQRLKSQQEYLDRLETGIAACSIKAPRDGRVVIARPSSSRSASQSLTPGDLVYRRQALFDIPRFNQLNVTVNVHETQVRHVEPGQLAEVRVDARPDEIFYGRVVSVASVPTSASYPNYDLKVYKAVVQLDTSSDNAKDLRPGLTARTTIIAEDKHDCRYVPAQAIVTVKGTPSVFVLGNDRVEVRPVELGLTTDAKVEITGGLELDDVVVLSPRTEYSEQLLAMMK